MCGIAGFTGPYRPELLNAMNQSLIHRGPDDAGVYADSAVNLGMTRLSIIDVDHGKQPIANETEDVWVICNGEIYNFIELRAQLESAGHRFKTKCDVEVIAHLYEEHGVDFVHHLNGMFAIALWDKKNGRLILIRDRMGVKPLYYHCSGGRLIFASEIKALLAHPDCPKEMNPEAVYHYFTFKNIPAPLTAFRGIQALSPGTIAVFEEGRLSLRNWWKIRFDRGGTASLEEASERLLDLLSDATRLRMRSDVPFGAFLSGGLDSSLIVGLMTRYSSKPVETFSLGYEKELQNKAADIHSARTVSRLFGTRHHEHIMSHQELAGEITRVAAALDQPFSGTISSFFLSKLIGRYVKVALAGDGADELFGSYLSHRIAQPMAIHARSVAEGRSAPFAAEDFARFGVDPDQFFALYEQSGGKDFLWRYRLTAFDDEEKKSLLNDEFLGACAGHLSRDIFQRRFAEATALDPLNRVLEMEWNTQLPDHLLLYADALSMAHSLEVRSPFLDYRLVEFAATLPGGMKIRNGNIKHVLKLAAKTVLPEEIIGRKKEGFVLPVNEWIQDDLREFCYDTLSESRLKKSGVIRAEYAAVLLKRFAAGEKKLAQKIWNLLMFQIWWEKYF